MIRILISILIALVISSTSALAQTKAEAWRYEGPRIGVDISRFLLPAISTGNRTGWELQADIPYKGNLFPTFETGEVVLATMIWTRLLSTPRSSSTNQH